MGAGYNPYRDKSGRFTTKAKAVELVRQAGAKAGPRQSDLNLTVMGAAIKYMGFLRKPPGGGEPRGAKKNPFGLPGGSATSRLPAAGRTGKLSTPPPPVKGPLKPLGPKRKLPGS